jgi:PKD repeat protein
VQWLKQSTAVSKIVGPILDASGVEYASAVIGDLSLSKNGGTLTALAAAATLTYIANGYYTLALTTGNTDTLGSAEISCNKATYQMPPREFMVLPSTVYDALAKTIATAKTWSAALALLPAQPDKAVGLAVLARWQRGANAAKDEASVAQARKLYDALPAWVRELAPAPEAPAQTETRVVYDDREPGEEG